MLHDMYTMQIQNTSIKKYRFANKNAPSKQIKDGVPKI